MKKKKREGKRKTASGWIKASRKAHDIIVWIVIKGS